MKSIRLKQLYILIIALVGGLLCGTSCVERFEMDLPLAVSSHNLKFGTSGGSTHVLVYSTGKWKIEFEKKIDWGSLDRVSGEGNSEFIFSYSDNYGVSRNVNLLLTSGEHKETICLYQSGELLEPALQFNVPAVTLGPEQQNFATPLSTDLVYNIGDIISMVTYIDEDGQELENTEAWLENIMVSSSEVTYEVSENNTGAARKAKLTLSITDADGILTTAIQEIVQESK